MHATAEAAKIRGRTTCLPSRPPLPLPLPGRAVRMRVHLYNPLLSRPSWISPVSCATDPPNHLHCTGGTATVVNRRKSAKGHRDTGNELQSADRTSLTRSFGHTECRSGSKEPLALPRGKLTADFEEGAARAEDRQTEEEFAPPARPAPARWRTEQTRCASKTRKNALGISRKRGGDKVHLD